MFTAVLAAILTVAFSVLIGAIALPITVGIVKAWTWLYTSLAPRDEREDVRAQVLSDLYEQRHTLLQDRHRPVEVAVLILLRTIWASKDDVVWAWPHLCPILMGKLSGGQRLIGNILTPNVLILGVAGLGCLNFVYFAADRNHAISEWSALNLGVVIGAVLVCHQGHPIARRVMYGLMGVFVASSTLLMTWLTIEHRLYEVPLFWQWMFSALPILIMGAINTKGFRARIFGGRWWPAILSSVAIICISIVTADYFAGSLITLLTVWAFIGLVLLSHVLMAAFIGLWVAVLCLATRRSIKSLF